MAIQFEPRPAATEAPQQAREGKAMNCQRIKISLSELLIRGRGQARRSSIWSGTRKSRSGRRPRRPSQRQRKSERDEPPAIFMPSATFGGGDQPDEAEEHDQGDDRKAPAEFGPRRSQIPEPRIRDDFVCPVPRELQHVILLLRPFCCSKMMPAQNFREAFASPSDARFPFGNIRCPGAPHKVIFCQSAGHFMPSESGPADRDRFPDRTIDHRRMFIC